MNNCNLCPRNCNTDRVKTSGFCNKPNKISVSKVMLHYGEEPYLTSKDKPASGAIFFSGCNLKCVYCQNYEISSIGNGKNISSKTLANLFSQLEKAGAGNIDLVTPTHFHKEIIKAIKLYKPNIPIIYNCGGYETEEAITELSKFIDIFLFDLKYYNNDLAIKYSFAPNYFEFASKAIKIASKLKPNIWNNEQLISGVVIRHLCLPTHHADSIAILDWIYKELGNNTLISIMSQYSPMGIAHKYPEINRTLKPLEYKIVTNHAQKLGFKNALLQDLNSNSTELVPNWSEPKQFKY